MLTKQINIDKIDVSEAFRYMGYGKNKPDDNIMNLVGKCEALLLKKAVPTYIYRVFELDEKCQLKNCNFRLEGQDIKKHLLGCDRAVLMCASLSAGVDRLIRTSQVKGMAEAMITDAMASVMVDQVCDKVEEVIRQDLGSEDKELFYTWRFGLGYGDFPLSGQKKFLEVLDAQKRVGVTVNESCMLIPTKSITCIIGVGEQIVHSEKKSCATCNMADRCSFRNSHIKCR